MTDRETELTALLIEGTTYLAASVDALHRLGVDMRGDAKPFIVEVIKAIGKDAHPLWSDALKSWPDA